MYQVRELAEKEGEGGVFQVLRQDVTRFLTTILIGTTYWLLLLVKFFIAAILYFAWNPTTQSLSLGSYLHE